MWQGSRSHPLSLDANPDDMTSRDTDKFGRVGERVCECWLTIVRSAGQARYSWTRCSIYSRYPIQDNNLLHHRSCRPNCPSCRIADRYQSRRNPNRSSQGYPQNIQSSSMFVCWRQHSPSLLILISSPLPILPDINRNSLNHRRHAARTNAVVNRKSQA